MSDRKDVPEWVRPALQGLTYWIGHRRSLYGQYPLGESALVAELSNLVYAHLDKTHRLRCEVQFAKFIKDESRPDILTEKARADMVIAEIKKVRRRKTKYTAKEVIEVKRNQAPMPSIMLDLKRLAAVKDSREHLRAFLIIVSESERPKRFVSKKGTALKGRHHIEDSERYYIVRRVYKAARSFSGIESANYACILEVQ